MDNTGFVIFVKKHREKSLFIKIFSEKSGIITGYLSDAINKNNFYKNQIGNYVNYSIKNKTIEPEINIIQTELIYSNLDIMFGSQKTQILIFNLSISLINLFLKDLEVNELVYKKFKNLIFSIKENNDTNIIIYYIDFLKQIVSHLGFDIDYSKCYITGNTENIYYISPKTANCVSFEVGSKYKNNLFIIPQCFTKYCENINDLKQAIKILNYFIYKFINQNKLFYIENQLNVLNEQLLMCLETIS